MKGQSANPVMTSRVGAVTLPNPVMTASGTAGYGTELAGYFHPAALGAIVVKSLSPQAWAGNPAPRVRQAGTGMLNSVGLQNPGIDRWLADSLPDLTRRGARVVVSIWAFEADGYRVAASRLAAAVAAGAAGAVVAVEANISCPNIEDRRQMFAHSTTATAGALLAAATGLGGCLPLWAKLSPNVTDLAAIAAAALDAGADGLVLTNTLMGMAIDPASGNALLGAGGGGLSGPPLHPVAVRAVYECRRAFPTTPIVGVGGVTCGADAAEFLAAGANAVQVGTATFADPAAPVRVLAELVQWCRHHHLDDISQLVGRAHAAGTAAGAEAARKGPL